MPGPTRHNGQQPLIYSPGVHLDTLSNHEEVQLAAKGKDPADYVVVEVGPAAFQMGVEPNGALVAQLFIRIPPKAVLDVEAPKLAGAPASFGHVGVGDTVPCLRLTVRRSAVTQAAKDACPALFPLEAAPLPEPPTFDMTGIRPAGGLLGAALGRTKPDEEA